MIRNCKGKNCSHVVVDGAYVETNATQSHWICPECKQLNPLPVLPPIATEAKGRKDDKDKLDWALLPLHPIRDVIKVLMWGEKNYNRDNWQLVANSRIRYYNAAMRHITAWFEGKKSDPDTKLPHLAHAVCCLLFLMWFDKKGHTDAD